MVEEEESVSETNLKKHKKKKSQHKNTPTTQVQRVAKAGREQEREKCSVVSQIHAPMVERRSDTGERPTMVSRESLPAVRAVEHSVGHVRRPDGSAGNLDHRAASGATMTGLASSRPSCTHRFGHQRLPCSSGISRRGRRGHHDGVEGVPG